MRETNIPEEWIWYCESGKKPDNIPDRPDLVYKDQGWISWSDFLGYDVEGEDKKCN
jgi:hypothetical protein